MPWKKTGVTDFVEEVASGAKDDRAELHRMLGLIREGDKVVVWRLDRLGRSVKTLIEILNTLNERGVEFQSVTENIDTSSPGGKLVFHLFGALAEFERDIIRQRVNAGLDAARARGRIGGRPRALTDKQVSVARAMKDTHSLQEIARHLGVGKSTVHRILT